jgi:hypothetical protein
MSDAPFHQLVLACSLVPVIFAMSINTRSIWTDAACRCRLYPADTGPLNHLIKSIVPLKTLVWAELRPFLRLPASPTPMNGQGHLVYRQLFLCVLFAGATASDAVVLGLLCFNLDCPVCWCSGFYLVYLTAIGPRKAIGVARGNSSCGRRYR